DLDAAHLSSDAASYARTALQFMRRRLEVDPPYAVLLSILDVKGGGIKIGGWGHVLPLAGPRLNRFDDDALILPAAVLEGSEADVKALLMPGLDMIWQAAGFDDCFLRRAANPW